ncbi:conjugal transfer protein TraB [Agrobacterium sp. V1]|uniref:conjugal transfer protein TraB n=1 Tax=Agrobacterium sp. V1 TaxID=3061957 RepID=UPI002671A890|nr:conjugal transfer protein TraB [Agrobacterium sp. V1]MDO3445446.1 conjugal transfer protein TraB [Agrobacterium sp. V1]
MVSDLLRVCMLSMLSALAGWIGWSGHVLLLPVTLAFPAIWSCARTRPQAALFAAAYFLSASRGLPLGVANYYASDIRAGLLLWLIASVSFVIVHCTLWNSRCNWQKPVRYLIACLVMAIPPFGLMGWAHPITAAGVLFPGWGWLGLCAMIAGMGVMTTRRWPAATIVLTGLWLWSAAGWTTPTSPASWQGVDLEMGASLGRVAGLARQEALVDILRKHPPGTTVVFPESALGFWTPTVSRLWRRQLAGSNIVGIAGAAIVNDDGYDNVLVSLSPQEGKVLYRSRMPVPGSMWQPWRALAGGGGARADFFANPVVNVGGVKIAPLICYEQLLVWPILQSALHGPEAIVAVGNGWWTAGTSVIDIQRASSQAWARLFDLPLVISFNT